MTRVRRCALSGLLVVAACGRGQGAAPLPPVPVDGPRADVRLLAGEWAGEVLDRDGTPQGTITFRLHPGRDTAQGCVTLRGVTPAPACSDPVSAAVRPEGEGTTRLRLGRVVIGDGSIAGWLHPYADLERGGPVDTWFEGRLLRDTLSGMFFAHPATGDTVRQGTWWAARRR